MSIRSAVSERVEASQQFDGRPGHFTEGLSQGQVRKGWVLVAVFLVLRLAVSRLWEAWFEMGYQLTLPFLSFLLVSFLVVSVGVVYVGFRCWVGIDLRAWWLRPGRVGGDIKWGVLAIVLGGIAAIAVSLGLFALGLVPPELMAAPAEGESVEQTLAQIPIDLVLGWVFGFAIASFTEETVFRGFIQGVLSEQTKPWIANLVQALVFAVSHIGMAAFVSVGSEAFGLLFRFGSGLLFGWLRNKRGSLLPGGIVHGFIG